MLDDLCDEIATTAFGSSELAWVGSCCAASSQWGRTSYVGGVCVNGPSELDLITTDFVGPGPAGDGVQFVRLFRESASPVLLHDAIVSALRVNQTIMSRNRHEHQGFGLSNESVDIFDELDDSHAQ